MKKAVAFYQAAEGMTLLGRHQALIEALPDDVAGLSRVVQGLFVHEYMAEAYGFEAPEPRKAESHIRPLTALLDRVLELDGRPLPTVRPVERRVIGVCHHPMLLLVGFLRAKGVPARGRCGQGAYFNAPFFEDHWLCEYWHAGDRRWVLADPQFDDVWRKKLKIAHDVLDVPRDQLLVAADAWTRCRDGRADPATFGIFQGNLRGLWFLAGSLVRDLAALNKVEMLPWDVWGDIPEPGRRARRRRAGVLRSAGRDVVESRRRVRRAARALSATTIGCESPAWCSTPCGSGWNPARRADRRARAQAAGRA